MNEVKALLKKSDKVWTCKSCGYSNQNKYLVTLHAETHVEGLMFRCRYCPKVYSKRNGLRNHIYQKHRGEGKQKENKRNAEEEVRESLDNKKKESKDDLDKEIDEKVEKLMEKDGQLWKC